MPQLPTTQVVTPSRTLNAMSGWRTAAKSSWVWVSMNPGARVRPVASIVDDAGVSTGAIRAPSITTSRISPGAPVPSMTVAPRILVAITVG